MTRYYALTNKVMIRPSQGEDRVFALAEHSVTAQRIADALNDTDPMKEV